MILGGVHVGPVLLALVLVVNLAGLLFLAHRLRRLSWNQRRTIGLLIAHGWAEPETFPGTGAHALRPTRPQRPQEAPE